MIIAKPRLDYLDSLRGIAALIVVFSHFALMVPEAVRDPIASLSAGLQSPQNLAIYSLWKLHMLARSGVILFFILSGFVLARSLSVKHTPYLAYVVKRFFRIYPALLVTVLLSYALHLIIGFTHPVSSDWLKTEVCDVDLSLKTLLKHLLLWGTDGSIVLDGAIWSLVHELRISLIFPVILWTVRRYRGWAVLGWLLISSTATGYMDYAHGHFITGFREATFELTWLDSVYFIVFFAAGAWLAECSDAVITGFKRCPFWLVGMITALCLYCMAKSDSSGNLQGVADYVRGIGALGIIALALSFGRFERLLSHRALIWVGRVSYSLYLIHMPIIYVIVEAGSAMPSLPIIIVAVTGASLLAAELMARLIEFPFNHAGKAIAARLVGKAETTQGASV